MNNPNSFHHTFVEGEPSKIQRPCCETLVLLEGPKKKKKKKTRGKPWSDHGHKTIDCSPEVLKSTLENSVWGFKTLGPAQHLQLQWIHWRQMLFWAYRIQLFEVCRSPNLCVQLSQKKNCRRLFAPRRAGPKGQYLWLGVDSRCPTFPKHLLTVLKSNLEVKSIAQWRRIYLMILYTHCLREDYVNDFGWQIAWWFWYWYDDSHQLYRQSEMTW